MRGGRRGRLDCSLFEVLKGEPFETVHKSGFQLLCMPPVFDWVFKVLQILLDKLKASIVYSICN